MSRPHIFDTYLEIAHTIAKRSTCARRNVGAVLADKHNRILATGHNGVPSGTTHCKDEACPGAEFRSGEGLNQCQAIHAEVNALLNCPDAFKVHNVFLTVSPCSECIKILMNTSAMNIVFTEEYVHEGIRDTWIKSKEGRAWINWPEKKKWSWEFSGFTGYYMNEVSLRG